MTWLLDTNVLSELRKKSPDEKVIEWIQKHLEEDVYLSVITIGEIEAGIHKLEESIRKDELSAWLNKEIISTYNQKILPIDTQTMMVWGKLTAELRKIGKPMPIIDSLITATAQQHELTLVTRNTSDFEAADIALTNPWL